MSFYDQPNSNCPQKHLSPTYGLPFAQNSKHLTYSIPSQVYLAKLTKVLNKPSSNIILELIQSTKSQGPTCFTYLLWKITLFTIFWPKNLISHQTSIKPHTNPSHNLILTPKPYLDDCQTIPISLAKDAPWTAPFPHYAPNQDMENLILRN